MILAQTSEKAKLLEPFGCQVVGQGPVDLYHLPASDYQIQTRSLGLSLRVSSCLWLSQTCLPPSLSKPSFRHPTPCSAQSPAQLVAAPCLAQARYLHTILEPSFFSHLTSNPSAILLALSSEYPRIWPLSSLLILSLLATAVSHLDDDDSPLSHLHASLSVPTVYSPHSSQSDPPKV